MNCTLDFYGKIFFFRDPCECTTMDYGIYLIYEIMLLISAGLAAAIMHTNYLKLPWVKSPNSNAPPSPPPSPPPQPPAAVALIPPPPPPPPVYARVDPDPPPAYFEIYFGDDGTESD
ncbi:E3 RID-alpha [Titi monkey adenovirus ECC-2011]|uniref:E3 RID-alpha n=1 Tax=titi monkey adenovirus 1 TaxID=3123084 RepID=G0ZAJ6_9ADEN|nr:E3 RID-alpha [Titi monkey adenovirus ECC-2011]AEK98467.1 E3 RID-alpha [Titi monkey adenovirus ECC-2011]